MSLSLCYDDAQFTQYTFTNPRNQCFSFPPDVISYILKNPISCEGYQKLNQTCKYFFLKQKIRFFMGETFCLHAYIWMNECQTAVKVDETNASFWFMDTLRLSHGFDGFRKIYLCTLTRLTLEDITMPLEQLDVLTSSNTIKKLVLRYSTVTHNGARVPIDGILGKLLNMVEFSYLTFSEDYSSQVFERMNKLKFLNKLQAFTLWMLAIDDNFDPEIVCKFVEKNAAASAKICFVVNLIPFKQALELAIHNLLEKWEGLKPSIKII